MLRLVKLLALAAVAVAHPLCGLDREFAESPVPRTLAYCTGFDETCCTLAEDLQIEDDVAALGLSATCEAAYKDFACARCSPFQAHLYNLESADPELDPLKPNLCMDTALDLDTACNAELGDIFLDLVADGPYCLPVELPNPGNSGLDVYQEISDERLIDYADAGETHGEFYATFGGKIYQVLQGSPALVFEFRDIFVQGELGLLTIELDTDFETNRIIWAYHAIQESVDSGNKRYTVLSRVTLQHQQGQEAEVCEILRLEQSSWNHNGGDIELLADGSLLLSLGDGAPQNGNGNGQDVTNLYGTLIRITPNRGTCNAHVYRNPELPENRKLTITDNYEIPAGNPLTADPNARSEIFVYGFRNPWRIFQDEEHHIYMGDVGQQLWEEVDLVHLDDNGTNYGWDIAEGVSCFKSESECAALFAQANYRPPVYDYPHFEGDLRPTQQHLGFSLSLGHIYSGAIRPELTGTVLMADYITQQVWAIYPIGETWTGAELVVGAGGTIVTIRKNRNGESVFLSLNEYAYIFKSQDLPAATYKNGVCEVGESCRSDPYDCPGDLKGQPKWCCADGECALGDCGPIDCGVSAAEPGCGNNYCDEDEDCNSCPWDCPGHEDANGQDFCCIGTEYGTLCAGPECTEDSCRRGNRQGDRNFKAQHD